MVGNFMGDFVRKAEDVNFSAGIRRGLELHRSIDTFTDRHPVVRESTKLLHAQHHKYAPVLLDVFYDFLLIKNWSDFSKQSLQQFTQSVYKILQKNRNIMPSVLQRRVPLMIADDWLVQYGKWEGLEFTFRRIRQRASQPGCFNGAVESLQRHEEALDVGFRQFFPEVVAYCSAK